MERFNLSDLKNTPLKEYFFLGKGGEHLVYTSPEVKEKKKVAKIDMESLLGATREKIKNGMAPSKETARPFIDEKNRRLEELKRAFGVDHVPYQKAYYLNVPINKRLLIEINNKFDGQSIQLTQDEVEKFNDDQTWAIVVIQDKLVEFADPNRISFASGYAENNDEIKDEAHLEDYLNVTSLSVLNLNSSEQIDIDKAKNIHSGISEVVETAKTDPVLKEQLKDFVAKSVQYSNQSGEILDIAGSDNVFFAKDTEGNFNYLIPDALYPGRSEIESRIEMTKKIIKHAVDSGVVNLEDWERNTLMNTLNYVRVINSLSIWLGLEQRISIIPDELEGKVTAKLLYEAITNKNSSQ